MKKWLIFGVLLSGCASTGSEDNEVDKATVSTGEDVVCVREKQVGSHFSRRICRTRAEMEERRREAEELLEQTRVVEGSVTPVE